MITVNGKEVKDQEEQTVADYLEENGYRMNRIAVELNGGDPSKIRILRDSSERW